MGLIAKETRKLEKMIDYREKLENFKDELVDRFIVLCYGNDYNKLTLLKIDETIDEIYEKHIAKATKEIEGE